MSGGHPAMIDAVGMSAAALVLLALSLFLDERWALPRAPEVVAAVVYSTIGSVGLFVLVLLVVWRRTASATSYMFVLFPVVTLALGALLAGEKSAAWTVGGALLVMAGVWFGALSRPPDHPVAAIARATPLLAVVAEPDSQPRHRPALTST